MKTFPRRAKILTILDDYDPVKYATDAVGM